MQLFPLNYYFSITVAPFSNFPLLSCHNVRHFKDERESLSADGAASGNNSQFESPPRPGTGQLLDLNSMALRQETIDDLVRGSSMSMQEQQPHQTLQLQPSSASLREHCLADTGADAQRNLQVT